MGQSAQPLRFFFFSLSFLPSLATLNLYRLNFSTLPVAAGWLAGAFPFCFPSASLHTAGSDTGLAPPAGWIRLFCSRQPASTLRRLCMCTDRGAPPPTAWKIETAHRPAASGVFGETTAPKQRFRCTALFRPTTCTKVSTGYGGGVASGDNGVPFFIWGHRGLCDPQSALWHARPSGCDDVIRRARVSKGNRGSRHPASRGHF